MVRDPRKLSAFDSGMRGSEKPKVQAKHGATDIGDGAAGGENKQGPGTKVGDPGGVGQSAYNSGMRGTEKPKQKSADAATLSIGGDSGGSGENKQGPNTVVGKPKGHNDAGTGKRAGVEPGAMQSAASDAYKMGGAGANLENSALGEGPSAEEDDTHINVRIPKSSLKKKAPGLQGN